MSLKHSTKFKTSIQCPTFVPKPPPAQSIAPAKRGGHKLHVQKAILKKPAGAPPVGTDVPAPSVDTAPVTTAPGVATAPGVSTDVNRHLHSDVLGRKSIKKY